MHEREGDWSIVHPNPNSEKVKTERVKWRLDSEQNRNQKSNLEVQSAGKRDIPLPGYEVRKVIFFSQKIIKLK